MHTPQAKQKEEYAIALQRNKQIRQHLDRLKRPKHSDLDAVKHKSQVRLYACRYA
jgi:hypothetical protein